MVYDKGRRQLVFTCFSKNPSFRLWWESRQGYEVRIKTFDVVGFEVLGQSRGLWVSRARGSLRNLSRGSFALRQEVSQNVRTAKTSGQAKK